MWEKISDRPTREEKVKRLKIKILSELTKELNATKEDMKWCIVDGDDDFDFLVKRSFALLHLREYIEDDLTFFKWESQYPNRDVIIYKVSDDELNIWLQDDYSVMFHFLTQAEIYGYDIFHMLNDDYFGYHFTSIMDKAIYSERKRKQMEVNANETLD